MSRIRGKDTVPELKVRSLIHKLGYRFRLHSKTLPGKPDLVFPSRKKIVFVHGCFWHAHSGCPKGRPPKSNLDYWLNKLEIALPTKYYLPINNVCCL
jgi:DNA mismatch endonuclease, patch repair protein